MRVTIDIDDKSHRACLDAIKIGCLKIMKSPNYVRRTRRGWHIVWGGCNISFKDSLKLREEIGDDPNRIRLDKISKKKLPQVLFSKKEVTYHDKKEINTSKRKIRTTMPIWEST